MFMFMLMLMPMSACFHIGISVLMPLLMVMLIPLVKTRLFTVYSFFTSCYKNSLWQKSAFESFYVMQKGFENESFGEVDKTFAPTSAILSALS